MTTETTHFKRCCLSCAWGHDWLTPEDLISANMSGACRYPIPLLPDSFLGACKGNRKPVKRLEIKSYEGKDCSCWLDKRLQAQANAILAGGSKPSC